MRLLISAGGTGGGAYPALSIAQRANSSALLWLGSRGGLEAEIAARAGVSYRAIHGAGLHGVGWRLPLNGLLLARGLLEALAQVRAFRPDVLLVTGGFITAPVALAAWLQRVPIVLYLPDVEPALALRFISRLARRIAVSVEDSRRFFPPRKVVVSGYPLRAELEQLAAQGAAGRAAGRAALGLDQQRPALLVTGGSRGARSINRAVFAALNDWLEDYQVVHLTGQLDWDEAQTARGELPDQLRQRYFAMPYLHEMGHALASADLVVSRAGASALGEYPLFGLPSILAPYPYAWRYQKVNADYLAARGAALRLADEDLAHALRPEVRRLLSDSARLGAMRAAAAAAAQPGAAEHIARELARVAGGAEPGVPPT